MALLRTELEATADRARQAVIQYEIGHLTQFALGNEAQAVREYLGAYNLDPRFRPPLIALVQVFERRRSMKNLSRLYEAEARSATTPREAASALADRASLMIDQGEVEGGLELLRTAFTQAAEAPDIALLLEHELLATGDEEAALAVTEARADLVRDPVLATLLRVEVARAKNAAGDTDAALAALRQAALGSSARWRVLSELERIAREHERWPELVAAVEGRARLARSEARGEEHGQHSGAYSVQRFVDKERAAAVAAGLFAEAARLRVNRLGDAAGAKNDLDSALELRPHDALLCYERMLACELAQDFEGAADHARALLEGTVQGPDAASLRFRLAEKAQAEGDVEGALAALRTAQHDDPSSVVIAATYDELVRGVGDVASAIEALLATPATGDARANKLFEAATLSARELHDAERARGLYTEAAAAASDPTAILREGYGAALMLGDADGAREHGEALLARSLDPEERSVLLRDLLELASMVLEDAEAERRILVMALDAPAASAWAPDVARARAAVLGDDALLAKSHKALAERAADPETSAAHLCAAARAEVRQKDDDGALETLRAALAKSPTHPYAVALLEEVLRARGDAGEVVRLLREAAEKADAPRAAQTQLLLAGAAAEAADDAERAKQAYEEAALRDPTSFAPMLSLRRLAEQKNDKALLLKALEGLSEREIALGEPGRHTLALAEHYDLFDGRPDLAEKPLRTALASPATALAAAVDLALLPIGADAHARLDGLTRILEHASDEARPGILREAAGTALREGDHEAAAELLRELATRAPDDRWAPIARMRLAASEPSRRAERTEAWMALGRATDDAEVGAEILLAGLRAQVFGQGDEASDDAVIVAHEILSAAPESLAAAIAVDESLRAGDDPEGRADALGAFLDRSGATGRLALESARGRALAAAGRPREALEVLLRIAATEPDDLASWEAIRVCARDCDAWEPLVEACDRLAHLLADDELTMLLLEESAAVLMDDLGQDARAERRLRRILAIDARRPIAYGRLHDLLAERGDDRGLLELVNNRIELVDAPEELGKLFYEQARLLRGLGRREEALGALDNLLLLDSDHLGGLALLVELQVQQENWGGAVEALRSLASANDVPGSQQRIARLGAADFLQNKLDDLAGALEELTALHEAGLADLEIYERAANVAVELDQADVAAEMIQRAVALAPSPSAVATLERRAGKLFHEKLGDSERAVGAYERALAAVPTDKKAAEALAALLPDVGRDALSRRFEASMRGVLEDAPTDPGALRSLLNAARWRRDGGLESAVLEALVALGLATDDEASAHAAGEPRVPHGTLDDAQRALVMAGGWPGDLHVGPLAELATAIGESAAAVDGLEPSGFGLGRGDLVRDASRLKTELEALCRLFGLVGLELYAGGTEPYLIDIAPYYKERLTFVAGEAVQSPLSPDQRFTVGMLAFGARLGAAPLVRRGPEGGAMLLFAAASAAEVPLAAGEGRAGMADETRRVYKAMPRRVRKALPAIVSRITDGGRTVDAWSAALHEAACRAGLIAANDLAVGLRRTIGRSDAEAVLASAAGLRMLHFWLSPDCIAMRQATGLSR
ncbi:MAG: hypothetical protein AB7S26_13715 [Sandaracinaceae bacterium]